MPNLISKRGPIIILGESGERPAGREDLEGAALIADDGPAYVKTPDGLQPCTIADMRSALGRLNQKQQKVQRGGFYDPEKAKLAARRSHAARKKKATE